MERGHSSIGGDAGLRGARAWLLNLSERFRRGRRPGAGGGRGEGGERDRRGTEDGGGFSSKQCSGGQGWGAFILLEGWRWALCRGMDAMS